MDELKDITDIQKKPQGSLVPDSAIIRTQPFGHNVAGNRAYARAERIAAAIHLVTNHIPRNEPARLAIREVSVSLLSALLALRDEMRASGVATIKAQLLIRKLISLLRVLATAGHISSSNAEVLIGTTDELGVFLISAQRTPQAESVALTRDEFFQAPVPMRSRGKRQLSIKDKTREPSQDASAAAHNRTQSVLGTLKAHGQIGIKDIAANLPEYSEKMIQRELKKMVESGLVKKMGSKRWSLYSLA